MEKEDCNNAVGFIFSLVNLGLAIFLSELISTSTSQGISFTGTLRFFELFGLHIAVFGLILNLLKFKYSFDYFFTYCYNYILLFFLFTIHLMFFEFTAR